MDNLEGSMKIEEKFDYLPRQVLEEVHQELQKQNIPSELRVISGIMILKVNDLIFLDDGNMLTGNIKERLVVNPGKNSIIEEIKKYLEKNN